VEPGFFRGRLPLAPACEALAEKLKVQKCTLTQTRRGDHNPGTGATGKVLVFSRYLNHQAEKRTQDSHPAQIRLAMTKYFDETTQAVPH